MGWVKSTPTKFKEEPMLSKEGEGRIIELVYDAEKWAADFESGVSIAWGASNDVKTVGYHTPTGREFIKFNGNDDKYKLPVDGAAGEGAMQSSTNGSLAGSGSPTTAAPESKEDVPTTPGNSTSTVDDLDAKSKGVSLCVYSALLLLSL